MNFITLGVIGDLFFENAAEVEDYLVVVPFERLEWGVGGEEDNDVGTVIGFFVVGEFEDVVRGNVGLNDEDVGVVATLHHLAHYLLCR